MRLIDADKIEFYGLNNRVCPDLSAMDVIDEQPTVSVIPAPVKCGECALHDHCRTEETFIFSRLPENKRFCGVSWRKDDEPHA